MSDEYYDFNCLYGSSNFPHLKILVDVANKHVARGIPLENVLKESLEFVVSEASNLHTELVINANKQVSDGLHKLAYYKSWPNLGKIAEHALELEEHLLGQEEPMHEDVLALTMLRRKILSTSISELGKMFKDEWLEENYPTLKAAKDKYQAEKEDDDN